MDILHWNLRGVRTGGRIRPKDYVSRLRTSVEPIVVKGIPVLVKNIPLFTTRNQLSEYFSGIAQQQVSKVHFISRPSLMYMQCCVLDMPDSSSAEKIIMKNDCMIQGTNLIVSAYTGQHDDPDIYARGSYKMWYRGFKLGTPEATYKRLELTFRPYPRTEIQLMRKTIIKGKKVEYKLVSAAKIRFRRRQYRYDFRRNNMESTALPQWND